MWSIYDTVLLVIINGVGRGERFLSWVDD